MVTKVVKRVKVEVIATGTIMYKGRHLEHQWPSKQGMVCAILAHQGFITETQIGMVYPKNKSAAAWVSWQAKRCTPKQKFSGEVIKGQVGGEDAVILKNGPSPLPWVENHSELKAVLAAAPKAGPNKVKKPKEQPNLLPKVKVPDFEEDDDPEDFE